MCKNIIENECTPEHDSLAPASPSSRCLMTFPCCLTHAGMSSVDSSAASALQLLHLFDYKIFFQTVVIGILVKLIRPITHNTK